MTIVVRDGMIISDGWELAEPFTAQSAITAVPSGAGVSAAETVLASRDIPGGALAYLTAISIRVIDAAAYDQLVFALKRNGAKIYPWDFMSGEQFDEDRALDIGQEFGSGKIEISATNISGTTSAGASDDAISIRCIARFKGYLLRRTR